MVKFPSKYARLTELYRHIGLERHAFKGIDKSWGFGEDVDIFSCSHLNVFQGDDMAYFNAIAETKPLCFFFSMLAAGLSNLL